MKLAVERDERDRGWTGPILFSGIAVLSLVVLYVLSMGPACWLADRQFIYSDNPYLVGFYWPIIRVSEICPPFGQFIGWYQSFWIR